MGKITNLRKLSYHRDYRIIGVSHNRGFSGIPCGRVSCRRVSYGRAALGPKLLRAEIAAEVAALILPGATHLYRSVEAAKVQLQP
jgi:hypothetical protein